MIYTIASSYYILAPYRHLNHWLKYCNVPYRQGDLKHRSLNSTLHVQFGKRSVLHA